jgi:glucokinase
MSCFDTSAANPDTYPRLLADIGGTNARFAWKHSPQEPLTDVRAYPCAAHQTLQSAIATYLEDHQRPSPAHCGIGIANPVTGDEVRMTNHHWRFSIRSVQAEMGFERLVVINDFAALALSLPELRSVETLQIGRGKAQAGGTLALIGPGTGLGVSGLLRAGDTDIPVRGEGGHVTLAATNDLEAALIDRLQQRFGHASAERALSGPGLVNLYTALCDLHATTATALSPAELVDAALADRLPHARSSLDVFFSLLGSTAGNLALSLGAQGGLYLGGGILPRLQSALLASSFREKFEAKGRLRPYMEAIPTVLITAEVSPALMGACRALDQARFTN